MENMKKQEFFDGNDYWRREDKTARLNPIKSIRAFCLQCVAGQRKEVELCPSVDTCPLWPFRFGTNPFHTKVFSEETKEKHRRHLQSMRNSRDNKDKV